MKRPSDDAPKRGGGPSVRANESLEVPVRWFKEVFSVQRKRERSNHLLVPLVIVMNSERSSGLERTRAYSVELKPLETTETCAGPPIRVSHDV